MKKSAITYVHGIEWHIEVEGNVKPVLKKFPKPRCGCKPVEGLICKGHLLHTFLGHPERFRARLQWLRVSKRSGGRCVVKWKGAGAACRKENPKPPEVEGTDALAAIGTDALKAWGVPESRMGVPKVKRVEIFVIVKKEHQYRLATIIRDYLSHPHCPNRLVPREIESGDISDKGWGDGTKRIHFQGDLTPTTLPTFGGRVRYEFKHYDIQRTPEYGCKTEVVLQAVEGKYLPKGSLPEAMKAMANFLLALCQAADVEPQPIYEEGRRLPIGSPFVPKGRGLEPDRDLPLKAARFADEVALGHMQPIPDRKELTTCILLTFAKPMHRNRLAKVLNKREAFIRFDDSYTYIPVSHPDAGKDLPWYPLISLCKGEEKQ